MIGKKQKVLLIFLALALVGCGKEKLDEELTKVSEEERDKKVNTLAEKSEDEEENPKEKTLAKKESNEDIKLVNEINFKRKPIKAQALEGAKAGSKSTLVEDRQVFKDFVDEKQMEKAKGLRFGIHLPKILLDSKDADQANEEIEKGLEELKTMYKDADDYSKDSDEPFVHAEFSTYQDEEILSLFIHLYNNIDSSFQVYRTYNFSIKDGKRLTDDKLLSYFAISPDQKLDLMEKSLADYYRHIIDHYDSYLSNPSYQYDMGNKEGFAIKDLWQDNPNIFYVNEVGRLMFFSKIYPDTGIGEVIETQTLAGPDYKTNRYSDDFVRMATKLGIDPDDEKVNAFIIYMGRANAEDTLPNVMSKLFAWQACFADYKDPRLILEGQRDPYDDNNAFLTGNDFYLVVPKWENAVISLRSVEKHNDGKVIEKDNDFLDGICQRSTAFICQSQEKDTPGVKIKISYRDKEIESLVSLDKKGNLTGLNPEIIDARKILDWDKTVVEYSFSGPLYEKILSIMGRG